MMTLIFAFLGAFVGSLVAIWYFNKKIYGNKAPSPDVKIMDGNPSGPPNEPPRREN